MALKGTLKKKKSGIKLQGSLGPFIGEFPLIASCVFLSALMLEKLAA